MTSSKESREKLFRPINQSSCNDPIDHNMAASKLVSLVEKDGENEMKSNHSLISACVCVTNADQQ